MPPSPSSPPRPSIHQPALDQAGLALQRQQPAEAQRLAAAVLKADRGNLAAAQLLGTALLLQNRPLEAIEALQRLARRSQHPALETLLARALAAAGRQGDAIDQLRQAAERQPPYLQAFLELGVALGEAGRLDEGVTVFERGLRIAPDADGLRVGLGQLHLRRNDLAAARQAFQQVHTTAPGRHDALLGLARVLALTGDHAAAADLYRRALTLRPDDPATRLSLGKCLLELGQRQAGEALIAEAARTGAPTGLALTALAATPHGRAFLRPSAAAAFLRATS